MLVVDDEFADLSNWTVSPPGSATAESGYVRRANAGVGTSLALDDFTARDSLIVAEISMSDTAGNPVLNIKWRRNVGEDTYLMGHCHNTAWHIYHSEAGSLSLSTFANHGGLVPLLHYWLVCAACGPNLNAYLLDRHPAMAMGSLALKSQLEASVSGVGGQFDTGTQQGNLGGIGLDLGANTRVHRLSVLDLATTAPA